IKHQVWDTIAHRFLQHPSASTCAHVHLHPPSQLQVATPPPHIHTSRWISAK
ncbi:hypothetical protein BX666DRAFT_1850500, partial [Dichotomocladium elegans]